MYYHYFTINKCITIVVAKSIGYHCWRQLSLANQNFIAAADNGCTGNGVKFSVVGGKIWKKLNKN
jgi:hypothetical protein